MVSVLGRLIQVRYAEKRGMSRTNDLRIISVIAINDRLSATSARGLLVKDEARGYALAIEIARSFSSADVQQALLRSFRRY